MHLRSKLYARRCFDVGLSGSKRWQKNKLNFNSFVILAADINLLEFKTKNKINILLLSKANNYRVILDPPGIPSLFSANILTQAFSSRFLFLLYLPNKYSTNNSYSNSAL